MSILVGDPLTQLSFSLFENNGVYALLVGSGLSRAAEIPTGWEITLDLIRRIAQVQGIEEQADWAKWYREQTGEEPDYAKLLQELATSPAERRSILHSYIEPTKDDREEGRKTPTAAHHAIATLVRSGYVRVIVTTNFDRLIENALREIGVEPTIVASEDALSGAEPITHSVCYILKLHGDYKDARIRNTDEELGSYTPHYDALLDRIFDEHGLIVCGWSGEWDHALRAAFLRAPNRRYPVFWTSRSKPGERAQELIDHRKAQLITIGDADTFFRGIEQRIETLGQTRSQNPLSVELLVKTVKRYLSRPDYRIQLDELIAQEADRVLAQISVQELNPQGSFRPEELRERIRRYETAVEPLARIVGVMGRWGDGSELPQILDLIRTFYTHAAKERSGLVIYVNLRSYPAVLVLTAYGLGLTRAQRWKTLHHLFNVAIPDDYAEPKRLVETLFPEAWAGRGAWKDVEGYEKHKTPLSDYLLALFSEWSRSFVGLVPDFELLAGRFDLLGSLAYLEGADEAELRKALAVEDPRSIAPMPVGRIGWRETNGQRLIQELSDEVTQTSLTEAGFANGRREFLDLFIKNFVRISGRMIW